MLGVLPFSSDSLWMACRTSSCLAVTRRGAGTVLLRACLGTSSPWCRRSQCWPREAGTRGRDREFRFAEWAGQWRPRGSTRRLQPVGLSSRRSTACGGVGPGQKGGRRRRSQRQFTSPGTTESQPLASSSLYLRGAHVGDVLRWMNITAASSLPMLFQT